MDQDDLAYAETNQNVWCKHQAAIRHFLKGA